MMKHSGGLFGAKPAATTTTTSTGFSLATTTAAPASGIHLNLTADIFTTNMFS